MHWIFETGNALDWDREGEHWGQLLGQSGSVRTQSWLINTLELDKLYSLFSLSKWGKLNGIVCRVKKAIIYTASSLEFCIKYALQKDCNIKCTIIMVLNVTKPKLARVTAQEILG